MVKYSVSEQIIKQMINVYKISDKNEYLTETI